MYLSRHKKVIDRLSEADRSYISGYRDAFETAHRFFSALEQHSDSPIDKLIIKKLELAEDFLEWMEVSEVDMLLAILGDAEYLSKEDDHDRDHI